jgi:hypothetical protein
MRLGGGGVSKMKVRFKELCIIAFNLYVTLAP